jgi:transcriptional regulator with XRE-family HTH domain
MYAIGKRIRAMRERIGMSQKAFADRIGAKNTTVSNWEKGLTRPDVDTLVSICAALECSSDELLDVRLSPEDMNEQERRVIMAYRAKAELRQAVNILLGVESDSNG